MRFLCFILLPLIAIANPTDMSVIHGQADLQASGNLLEIQTSHNAIINWESFSIGSGETTRFCQPSADSAVLNRVIGGNMSEIYGNLQANGRVYLINPNGIIVGSEGVINTAAFIATTLQVTDKEFLADEGIRFLGDSKAEVHNFGTIVTPSGPTVLLAHHVKNEGNIKASVASLGSGHEFYLQKEGIADLLIKPESKVSGVENKGVIEGMIIQLQSDGATSFAIRQSGQCKAVALQEQGGKIYLKAEGIIAVEQQASLEAPGGLISVEGELLHFVGEMDVSGERAGEIKVDVIGFYDDGVMRADGDKGCICIHAMDSFTATTGSEITAIGGGEVTVYGEKLLFSSGSIDCSGAIGGEVYLFGQKVALSAALIDVSAESLGGKIYIGGGQSGAPCRAFSNAKQVIINPSTQLLAAKDINSGGQIILWADEKMDFCAKARAAFVEVSGGELLHVGSIEAKELLLDPNNIIIETPTGNNSDYPQTQFVAPLTGTEFGEAVAVLENGNVVITQPGATVGGNTNAGAAHLFNGATGGLINSLTGTATNDSVAIGGVTTLATSSNYVVISDEWNGTIGAATFVNGSSGISAVVSSANSLVGSNAGDSIGSHGVTALVNGNYVVVTPTWAATGAVTWGSGSSGISGVVSVNNSVTGSTAGSGGVFALNDGNYVISSPSFVTGGNTVGAATWVNGSAAPTAGTTINTGNSIYGGTTGDTVSSGGIVSLVSPNEHNFIVLSPHWHNAGNSVGAVTWSDGTVTGAVSVANSIYGASNNDDVSSAGAVALSDGNYVIASPGWNGGLGAATWGSGNSATAAVVSTTNSVTGQTANDQVASAGVYALTNGAYIICSPNWINGALNGAGAATYMVGAPPANTNPSATNSLYGANANDNVSSAGVLLLSSGAYVVASPNWDGARGAATYAPSTGLVNTSPSGTNSIIGTNVGDNVSSLLPVELADGNYVVRSPNWSTGAGAATWSSGTTPTGTVSATNSFVGNGNGNIGTYVIPAGSGYIVGGTTNAAYAPGGSPDGNLVGTASGTNSVAGSPGDLTTPLINTPNTYFIAPYPTEGSGVVRAGVISPYNVSSSIFSSLDMTVSPNFVETAVLAGTNITFAAEQNITISNPINMTGVTNTSFTLTAGNNIIINSGIVSTTTALNFTAGNNITIADSIQLATSGANTPISLIAGNNLTGAVGAPHLQILATGAGSAITLVAANNASSPNVGTGIISLDPATTLNTNGGNVRLYTSSPTAANVLPTTINGVATPGTFITLNTYYPNGTGGVPFQIFYQFGGSAASPTTANTQLNASTSSVLTNSSTNKTPENDSANPANAARLVLSPKGLTTTSTAPCEG